MSKGGTCGIVNKSYQKIKKWQDPSPVSRCSLGFLGRLHCHTFGHCNIPSRACTEKPNTNASHHHHTVHCLPTDPGKQSRVWKTMKKQFLSKEAWTCVGSIFPLRVTLARITCTVTVQYLEIASWHRHLDWCRPYCFLFSFSIFWRTSPKWKQPS